MLTQFDYTLYITGFNMMHLGFHDQAVITLELQYKQQIFFLILLSAMQT